MAEPNTLERLVDAIDILGEATDFLEAIWMMASAMDTEDERGAIHRVSYAAKNRIVEAKEILSTILEPAHAENTAA